MYFLRFFINIAPNCNIFYTFTGEKIKHKTKR